MNESIYKFERNMLHGKPIYIKQKKDSSWFKKHWHNYYEIVYYKKCTGTCIMNGEDYPITDNSLFLLTPKDFHQIIQNSESNSCSLIIAFNEQILDSSVIEAIIKGPFISYNVSQNLSSKLDELYETFISDKKYKEQYLKHLFNCILIDILNNADSVSGRGNEINPIVRESILIMLSDPTADLTLDFFATKFNVSKTYFSRLFHICTDISFKQYITSLRLEYAKQLLEENKIPIIDVGYECGFNTPSQFFRAFKKVNQISPSDSRKQKNKKE